PPDPLPPVLIGSGIPREDHAHRVKLPNTIGYRTEFPQHAQLLHLPAISSALCNLGFAGKASRTSPPWSFYGAP
ncbi:hypothetical protein LEMLEM_LOCUS3415, partial [Lemmus lemmus]